MTDDERLALIVATFEADERGAGTDAQFLYRLLVAARAESAARLAALDDTRVRAAAEIARLTAPLGTSDGIDWKAQALAWSREMARMQAEIHALAGGTNKE